jgi:drug/metabolite transporter (DMT)-like permease
VAFAVADDHKRRPHSFRRPSDQDAALTPASQSRLGIGLMCLGVLMFALNDVMGKWLMSTYTVGQVLLLRSISAILILAPFIIKEGVGDILRAPRPGLQLLRVAFGTLETACFYWAVTTLPLVSVMTYYLAAPLYVAAIAPLLLGERIHRDQWIAVILGFFGVLCVLQPSAETLTLPAMIAIVGSALYAGLMLTTRQLRGTSATSLIAWQTTGALVFGAALAPFGWMQPSARDFALLALLGVVAMAAHMLVTQSLRIAKAAIVAPFQYTLIVWAALFGWLFFNEWPNNMMILGTVVIVGSGLYLLWREGRPEPPLAEDPP